MKKVFALFVLIATAIAFGTMLFSFLKKAGFEDIFDFDLYEDIDNEKL